MACANTTSAQRRRARGRVAAALVMALLASGCAGGARTARPGDRPRTTGSGPSSVAVPRSPATTSPGTPPRPARAVAVTRDGRLVVLDAGDGAEVRQLARFEDPTAAPPPEDAWRSITSVSVTPDGAAAYFDTCCEPASGVIHRVATGGGTPERVFEGSHPAVSPDGGRLAFAAFPGVVVADLPTGARTTFADERHLGTVAHLSWSADGRALTYQRMPSGGGAARSEVVLLRVAPDGSLRETSVVRSPGQLSWDLPRFRHDGRLVVTEQCCLLPGSAPHGTARNVVLDERTGRVLASFELPAPLVDAERGPGGAWTLLTYADGTLAWEEGGGSGPLGTGYLSADW